MNDNELWFEEIDSVVAPADGWEVTNNIGMVMFAICGIILAAT